MENENRNLVEKEASEKKAYASPKLVEYGSLSKLTQGGASQAADSSLGVQGKKVHP